MKDICNELDVRSLCHKILQNVSILLNADRGSLFLVQGEKGGGCSPAMTPRPRFVHILECFGLLVTLVAMSKFLLQFSGKVTDLPHIITILNCMWSLYLTYLSLLSITLKLYFLNAQYSTSWFTRGQLKYSKKIVTLNPRAFFFKYLPLYISRYCCFKLF